MTMREKSVMQNAMMYSLLLDKGSGVYWDFDFDKEEFLAGTAFNVGLISGVTQKYEEGVRQELHCGVSRSKEESELLEHLRA